MKKFTLISFIAAALCLTSCTPVEKNKDQEHQHTFSDTFKSDETHHWHESTCGHDVISGKAEHSYGEWSVVKEATCTEDGSKERTCVCGKKETEVIQATGHTFSDEWTKDASGHWHSATCGHDEIKDFAEHSYVKGVCEQCGFIDPDYEPDKFYLPSMMEYYDSECDDITVTYDFEYDSDLLGFTKTKLTVNDYRNDKEVYKVRYEDDSYTNYTEICEEYEFRDGTYEFIHKKKDAYKFYSNETYPSVEEHYSYGWIDEGEPVLTGIHKKCFNNRGQNVHDISYGVDEDNDNKIYLDDDYETIYNDKGLVIRENQYENDWSNNNETYLFSYTDYTYNDDFTSGSSESFEFIGEEYVKSGSSAITIVENNGIREIASQLYHADGELGNYNVHRYNSDFKCVYVYYGGIPETREIRFDENGNVNYYFNQETSKIVVNGTYNSDDNLASSVADYDDGVYTETATYEYNQAKQMSKASCLYEFKDDGELPFTNYVTISYSELQCDLLLKAMDFTHDIVGQYSGYVFAGESLI